MPAFGANTAIGANGVPNFSHIFVLVMENKERGDIIGNSAAPYINQLATTYSQGANNHGVSHPSLPNYLAMISGDTWGSPRTAVRRTQPARSMFQACQTRSRPRARPGRATWSPCRPPAP